jgi:diguanylate cyclase (GGDEF)-like protein
MLGAPNDDVASLKAKIYRWLILLGLAANLIAALLNELGGVATTASRLLGVLFTVVFLIAWLGGRRLRERVVISSLYLLLALIAAGWLYALYGVYGEPFADIALFSLPLWLPALYAMFFVVYRPQIALVHVLVALTSLVILTLPHAVRTLGQGGLFDGIRLPVMLALAHLALVLLLWSYAKLAAQLRQVREEAKAMSRLAYTDELTGFANRRLLEIELVRAMSLARREGWPLALLYLNLEQFKVVNDRFGEKAGDEVLRTVAQRLKGCLGERDLLARLGGDKFVLLLVNSGVAEAIRVCSRVVFELSQPLTVGGQALRLTASIGVVTYPENGEDLHTLLQHADRAMRRAKAQGGGFAFHEEAVRTSYHRL